MSSILNQNKIFEVKIDEIESELKRIGYWSDSPCRIDITACVSAFCEDKLAFSEWLQFVLIPMARNIIAEKKQIPTGSMLGVKAMREYDHMSHVDEAETLVKLLAELDDICNGVV